MPLKQGWSGGSQPPSGPLLKPTDEQVFAVDTATAGEDLIIQALAGSGKTSTLRMCAEAIRRKEVRYLAFNKRVAEEAKVKFDGFARASTMHSAAFQAVGRKFQTRLNAPRMNSAEMARKLDLDKRFAFSGEQQAITLSSGKLASLVKQAAVQFCFSDDLEPSVKHFPYLDGIDRPIDGKRTYDNNNLVASEMLPYLQRMWEDWTDVGGKLPYPHDAYLKQFQLEGRQIGCDVILYDEAQDSSPVMTAIVAQQRNVQRIVVGDSFQQLYAWRGAIDALQMFGIENVSWLTQSFRFGQEVADVANVILRHLQAPVLMQGNPNKTSSVGFVQEPDVILTRSNAEAVAQLLASGGRVHLVGNIASQVRSFAEAALALQEGQWTSHPELSCFDSWDAVRHYVIDDPSGVELRLLVELVDKNTPERIIKAVNGMPRPDQAERLVCTAHQSKGLEWPKVRIADDFPPHEEEPEPFHLLGIGPEEWRLMYVAVTRAQERIDHTQSYAINVLPTLGNDDHDADW